VQCHAGKISLLVFAVVYLSTIVILSVLYPKVFMIKSKFLVRVNKKQTLNSDGETLSIISAVIYQYLKQKVAGNVAAR